MPQRNAEKCKKYQKVHKILRTAKNVHKAKKKVPKELTEVHTWQIKKITERKQKVGEKKKKNCTREAQKAPKVQQKSSSKEHNMCNS